MKLQDPLKHLYNRYIKNDSRYYNINVDVYYNGVYYIDRHTMEKFHIYEILSLQKFIYYIEHDIIYLKGVNIFGNVLFKKYKLHSNIKFNF